MKIVIFGVGNYLKKRYELIKENLISDEIVCFIDNSVHAGEAGDYQDKRIFHPSTIESVDYDCVVIASDVYFNEMRDQLLKNGVHCSDILSLDEYYKKQKQGTVELHIVKEVSSQKKNVLIISTELNYGGGSLAIYYAAKALDKKRYDVTVATPAIEDELLYSLNRDGVNVIVCQSLPYIGTNEIEWMSKYEVAIVNVFQNINIAYKLSKNIPVLWWIHEPMLYTNIYERTLCKFERYREKSFLNLIRVVAVSEVAKKNFNSIYRNVIQDVLPYGIVDEKVTEINENNPTVIAVIGALSILKGQDVLIAALSKLSKHNIENMEIWLIGEDDGGDFARDIRAKSMAFNNIKFLGVLSRGELRSCFERINIVLCCSREETMSLAITEGMMQGKVCIASDAIGMAKYIEHNSNGVLFKNKNDDDLADKMNWILNNKDKWYEIGKKARETYETYFCMDVFSRNLTKELTITIDDYCHLVKRG